MSLSDFRRIDISMVIVSDCLRNLGLHRGGEGTLRNGDPEILIVAHNNFLYVAALKWCKILGDEHSDFSWRKIVIEPNCFYERMLATVGIDELAFNDERNAVRESRDKYVAHYDADLMERIDRHEGKVPVLETALNCMAFFFDVVGYGESDDPVEPLSTTDQRSALFNFQKRIEASKSHYQSLLASDR